MEIDNLSISINAKAKSANEAIDRLIGKLDSLTASMRKLNPSNLNGLANGVQKLGTAMQTMKDVKKTDFNKVARGISAFEKIDSAKLSSLSTTLSPLATSIGTLGAVKFDNKNIQTLINSLTRLSNANLNSLANVNFTQFGNSINQLSASLSNTPKIQQSVISMTNAIANLSKSGANMPIVATSLQTLGGSLSNFMSIMASAPSVTDSTVTFTQAISSLANAGAKAGVTASNLGVLGAQLKNLMATLSTAPMISQSIIDMTNALANLSAQGSRVGSASRGISNGLNRTYSSTVRASKGFRGLTSAIGMFYARYFLVMRAIKALGKAVTSTADYIEAYNYFNVALGKIGSDWSHQFEQYGYENAEAYAESFNKRLTEGLKDLSGVQVTIGADGKGLLTETGLKNLGLNIREVTQYASQLASVTNSVGQTGEVSLATANAFTKLGADMSSLFNVDYSSVMQNLQSGLIGQSRALYKYGIDITNATLQTKAYQLGLTKAVSEMTQMEKQQLRVISILEQSKVSWGDLANTINSPSNLIRIFKNNLKETGMVFGQLFIPMLSKAMPVLNGLTIAFKRLLVDIAGFMGVELDLDAFGQGYNELEDETGSLGDSYDELAESIKSAKVQLLGFDEVNKLQEPTNTSGLGIDSGSIDLTDEILKATEEYQKAWQEAFDKMEANSNKWADRIEKSLSRIGEVFEDFTLGEYFKAGEDVSDLVIDINNFISKAIKNVDWKGIGNNVGLFLKGIKWTEIFMSLQEIFAQGMKGIFDFWIESMKESPIETAILTAIAMINIAPIRAALASKIATAGGSVGAPFKIGVYLTILVLGTELAEDLGNVIGKALYEGYDPYIQINARNEYETGLQGIEDRYKELEQKAQLYAELSKNYENLSAADKQYVAQLGQELLTAGIVEGINEITKAWEGTNEELSKAIQQQKILAGLSSAQGRLTDLETQYEEELARNEKLKKESEEFRWNHIAIVKDYEESTEELKHLENLIKEAQLDVADFENDYKNLMGIIGEPDTITDTFEAKDKKESIWKRLSKDVKAFNRVFNKYGMIDKYSPLREAQKQIGATGVTSIYQSGFVSNGDLTEEQMKKLDELLFKHENVDNEIESNPIKININNSRYINGLNYAQSMFTDFSYLVNNSNLMPSINGLKAMQTIQDIANKYNTEKNTIENKKINPTVDTSTAKSQTSGLFKILNQQYGTFKTTVKVEEDKKSLAELAKNITEKISSIQLKMDIFNVGKEVMATFKSIIPGFATGGFPEDGLFFANHNELVGGFGNGKTAVANNEQITQGIAQAVAPAVYNAVVSAMQNTQRGNSDVVVNIDGKQVFKAVQKQANDYTAQTGLTPFNI